MCVQCGDDVRVLEAPRPFIDPARFVCHLCLSNVPALFRDNPGLQRTEIRPYDPDLAVIPF
jgi:hypothetical protein